jgi:hypothetical protein
MTNNKIHQSHFTKLMEFGKVTLRSKKSSRKGLLPVKVTLKVIKRRQRIFLCDLRFWSATWLGTHSLDMHIIKNKMKFFFIFAHILLNHCCVFRKYCKPRKRNEIFLHYVCKSSFFVMELHGLYCKNLTLVPPKTPFCGNPILYKISRSVPPK